jgi:hypothetical protein
VKPFRMGMFYCWRRLAKQTCDEFKAIAPSLVTLSVYGACHTTATCFTCVTVAAIAPSLVTLLFCSDLLFWGRLCVITSSSVAITNHAACAITMDVVRSQWMLCRRHRLHAPGHGACVRHRRDCWHPRYVTP